MLPSPSTALLQVRREIIAGDVQQATTRLTTLLANPATKGNAHYLLAIIYQWLGEHSQARENFALACCLDPAVEFFHRHLGKAYPADQLVKRVSLYFTDLALRPACPPPRQERPALANVTLCAVDCLYYDLTLVALKNCLAQCDFAAIHLYTDQPFNLPTMECRLIPAIKSLDSYSHFMIKKLTHAFSTDHILFAQWDGFILDGQLWRPEFLDWDYIGAKWWYEDGYRVGNGGFSLRSRKLLQALADEKITKTNPEDVCICRSYRLYLEKQYGIRIAPDFLADDFSFERCPGGQATFGFHGLFHFARLRLINPELLEAFLHALPTTTLQGVEAQELIAFYIDQNRPDITVNIIKTILQRVPDHRYRQHYARLLNTQPGQRQPSLPSPQASDGYIKIVSR